MHRHAEEKSHTLAKKANAFGIYALLVPAGVHVMRHVLTITVALLLTHQPVMPQELAIAPMSAIKLPTAPPTLSADCRTKRVAGDLFRRPLRALSRAVRAKRQVRVLAIGSSSTAGVGASSPSATYIAKLETSLEGSLQGMSFFGYGNFVTARGETDIAMSRHWRLDLGYQMGTRLRINGGSELGIRLTQKGPLLGLKASW